MLVRGVRSSWEASATNSRWRTSADSVSSRAASSWRSMSSSVCGQLGHLVVGLGARQRLRRVARARHLASGAGEPGDRAHRATSHGEAGQKGQAGAAEDPQPEEEVQPVDVPCTLALGFAYWTNATGAPIGRAIQVEAAAAVERLREQRSCHHPEVADVAHAALDRRAEVGLAAGAGERRSPLPVDHADRWPHRRTRPPAWSRRRRTGSRPRGCAGSAAAPGGRPRWHAGRC